MNDDDYVPSRWATANFNVRDGLRRVAAGESVRGRPPRSTFFRGGVELRSVWDAYPAACRSDDPPATRLMYLKRLLGLSYPGIGDACGVNHTSILRLAHQPGVPYRKLECSRAMLHYINRQLELNGYAPITAAELFPLNACPRSMTRPRYTAWLVAMGD